jgi:hypothetical protein
LSSPELTHRELFSHGAIGLAAQYHQALTVFALRLAGIRPVKDLEKPIAISLDRSHPSVFRVVKEPIENGAMQVTLEVLTSAGKFETVKIIPDAGKALTRIEKLSPDQYNQAYAQGIHILLATTANLTNLAIETQRARASLEHALPTDSLALIDDERAFEAQAQILVEGLLRIKQLPEFNKDLFYLTGEFNVIQKTILEALIEKNKLASIVQLGKPQGKSAVVRYTDTAQIKSTPAPNTGVIQFPVTGLEKDQVLDWYSVIREAGSVGGVYAAHFNGQEILFDQVDANALPEQTYLFHNTRAVKPLSDRLHWKKILEGHVTLDEFRAASFYMPLERFEIDLLVQGARLALKSIGGSA